MDRNYPVLAGRNYPAIGFTPGSEIELAYPMDAQDELLLSPLVGVELPFVAASVAGNFVVNKTNRKLLIVFRNNHATPATNYAKVTVQASGVVADAAGTLPTTPPVINVNCDDPMLVGPFDANFEFTGRKVYLSYAFGGAATIANLEVAVILLP